jgi:hypothetical protein
MFWLNLGASGGRGPFELVRRTTRFLTGSGTLVMYDDTLTVLHFRFYKAVGMSRGVQYIGSGNESV